MSESFPSVWVSLSSMVKRYFSRACWVSAWMPALLRASTPVSSAALGRQAFRTSTIMLWSTISASLCTLPLALALESHVVPGTLRGWLVVLALAWLTHAAGQGLIAYAVASLPPAFSSLTLLIQPVVAALLAVVILNEPLTSLQIFGGLIILAGIGVAKRG